MPFSVLLTRYSGGMATQTFVAPRPAHELWVHLHFPCSMLKRLRNLNTRPRSVARTLLYWTVRPRTHLFPILNDSTTSHIRLPPTLVKPSPRHRKHRALRR
jgi:hypothetical protein